jgi:hypothetical protein
MQKGEAMHKIQEEACTLLLGSLVMNVHTSLQQFATHLSVMESMPESWQPRAEALYPACFVLLSVFQSHCSEASFWTALLQPESTGSRHPGLHRQLLCNNQSPE